MLLPVDERFLGGVEVRGDEDATAGEVEELGELGGGGELEGWEGWRRPLALAVQWGCFWAGFREIIGGGWEKREGMSEV